MTLIILNSLFALVSIVLCIVAPNSYSYSFCTTILGLFLAQNLLYFIFCKKKNWFGFEFFFAISFLFCNFIYPTLYYPTRPNYSFFDFPFNHDTINRATAIAYFAYTFYMLGVTKLLKMNREEPPKPTFHFGMNQFLVLFFITIVSFGLYLLLGGWKQLQSVYSGGGELSDVGIYSYFNNIFTFSSYLLAMFVFRLKRQHIWFYIGFVIICMLIVLSTGSRSLALSLALILIVGFNNFVRRFKLIEIVGLTLAGAFALFILVCVREAQINSETITTTIQQLRLENFTDIFTDLIINNYNLYVLVEYADSHSLTFFHGMLIDIFSPFPGMSSRIINHFHEPMELLNGGTLPSYLILGADASWGLGTNMVGEAFRSFGYVGTAISMFLIGQIVKSSYYRSFENQYWYAIFYLFVSHAVFYPRAPLIFDPRTIVWSLLLVWLISFVTRPIRQEQIQKLLRQ